MSVNGEGPSAEHIVGVFERYASLMCAGDADAIAELYAEDAVLRDPVTSPPHTGREAIRAWYRSSFDNNGGAITMTIEGAVRVAGNWGAAAMTAVAGKEGRRILIETLDVIEFDQQGHITRLDAYWGRSNVRSMADG